ncbi:hypothetical protein C8F01DRAFT_48287 [Mycena amicta]|nr:hypothetical protein C8F01DRAFT_48287 [Mycena amicta]
MKNVPPIPTAVYDLWFPDGTLVIRAGVKLFKVTKSIIAARSTVFRDMLALPQEPGDAAAEVYEGCPSVTLTDEADDVEVFLRAIFDSSYFMPHPEPFKRLPLLGILRLSHKYDVQYLFKRGLKHLEPAFPIAFGSMDSSSSDYFGLTANGEKRADISIVDRNQLMTIDALRRVSALWLLPAAFYLTCQSLSHDLLTAVGCKNVDLEDIILCVRGKRILSLDHTNIFSRLHGNFLADRHCTTEAQCRQARQAAVGHYFETVDLGYDSDIFASWVVDPHCARCVA